jgi:hypothetical protein
MDMLYSNELKAVVITENFLDNPKNVLKENCLTVQHFEYLCEHKRNNANELYGATQSVILKFTVRVNAPHQAKAFYKRLLRNGYDNFSLLFNATFNVNQRLDNYEDGMIVNGYVIGIEEDYNSSKNSRGIDEQMTLNVQLLVRSITYLGRERNHINTFIK